MTLPYYTKSGRVIPELSDIPAINKASFSLPEPDYPFFCGLTKRDEAIFEDVVKRDIIDFMARFSHAFPMFQVLGADYNNIRFYSSQDDERTGQFCELTRQAAEFLIASRSPSKVPFSEEELGVIRHIAENHDLVSRSDLDGDEILMLDKLMNWIGDHGLEYLKETK